MKKMEKPNFNQQSGVALIEVLVTMVIVAIGLLALMTLQVHTMSTSQGASERYRAALLAQDLGERIRANASTDAQVALYAIDWGGAPACGGLCQIDLDEWLYNIYDANPVVPEDRRNMLPNGEGRVEILPDAANPQSANIEIRWRDKTDDNIADDEGCGAGFRCYSLTIPL